MGEYRLSPSRKHPCGVHALIVLARRILSAILLVTFLVGSALLDVKQPLFGVVGLWMLPVFLFMTLGTLWEMTSLIAKRIPLSPLRVLAFGALASAIGLVPLWSTIYHRFNGTANLNTDWQAWIAVGLMVTTIGTALDAILRYSRIENSMGHDAAVSVTLGWFANVAALLYVVGPMLLWWPIRMMGDSTSGMTNMVGIVLVTKMADTGAYFTGKRFGRIKLCPAISPGKTVEGFVGGCAASVVSAYIWYRLIFPMPDAQESGTLWGPAALAVLLTAGGLVGDLTESMVKRTVGEKDSGSLLPGLGGIWDVTDALIPATVLGYLGLLARLH